LTYEWHTSVAASLGPDLASRATSSNNDEVDATSVDGVVGSSAAGWDLRLIHCGRILAKFDALELVRHQNGRLTFAIDLDGGCRLDVLSMDLLGSGPLLISSLQDDIDADLQTRAERKCRDIVYRVECIMTPV
jgi:hypothetical protein